MQHRMFQQFVSGNRRLWLCCLIFLGQQEMLVTVADQCEQKIMDIREQEKQGNALPLVGY